ncbi:MAG: hypothetical protein EA369_06530 [Bradymonadales bacterium]|nr:MAG: hypothetical protein EA369_06530 [Bradymonadales bacterium]
MHIPCQVCGPQEAQNPLFWALDATFSPQGAPSLGQPSRTGPQEACSSPIAPNGSLWDEIVAKLLIGE